MIDKSEKKLEEDLLILGRDYLTEKAKVKACERTFERIIRICDLPELAMAHNNILKEAKRALTNIRADDVEQTIFCQYCEEEKK